MLEASNLEDQEMLEASDENFLGDQETLEAPNANLR